MSERRCVKCAMLFSTAILGVKWKKNSADVMAAIFGYYTDGTHLPLRSLSIQLNKVTRGSFTSGI